jgi:glutathione S-transferase
MRLIGMLDSPYVRRVAISLRFMRIPFAHEAVSVFRDYEQFSAINPVVKAPTLVTDDDVVLMDSSLILDYAERLASADRRLAPARLDEFARAQRVIGLALAACDKSVQLVYERTLRPVEKQHRPWIDRVHGQLLAAYRLLGTEVGTAESGETWLLADHPLQPDISVAVAWYFTHSLLPDVVDAADHPALAAFSKRAEALPEFRAFPHDG